ncbi:MAG: T9SS type A sorting domain-containing protein, partial [Fimbriimonadaceae bacterium]|nr:T9SS type A sorting domain-containing protein [Chitinophagales bacterium]
TYEIKLLPSLPNGTPIYNSADIYFDYNPPVYTESVKNTVTDIIPNCTDEVKNYIANNITIYPNPSDNHLIVQSKEIFKNASFYIYDISSKMIMSEKNINGNLHELNISDLSSGLYIFEIFIEDEILLYKFVKQ